MIPSSANWDAVMEPRDAEYLAMDKKKKKFSNQDVKNLQEMGNKINPQSNTSAGFSFDSAPQNIRPLPAQPREKPPSIQYRPKEEAGIKERLKMGAKQTLHELDNRAENQEYKQRHAQNYTNIYVKNQYGKWEHIKEFDKDSEELRELKKQLTQAHIPFKEGAGPSYREQRLSKWKTNLKNTRNQVQQNAPGLSSDFADVIQATRITKELPTMAIPSWGSYTNKPQYQTSQSLSYKTRKPKRPISHQQMLELQNTLQNQGLDPEQISEYIKANGFLDTQSEYFQSTSKFGPGVMAYKPVSRPQTFLYQNPPESDFTRPYFLRHPEEKFTGFKPETLVFPTGGSPSIPAVVIPRFFSPMEQSIDANGNIVKRFPKTHFATL
jgi:hypothetical protein